MIKLEGISKTYTLDGGPAVEALNRVDLEVNDGEFLVIIGRSGSGKTTLLNVAAGLIKPSSGTVWLDGTDLWSLPDKEQSQLRNRKLGFVFQFPSLIPTLSVLENVMLPLSFGGSDSEEGRRRALDLIETVGLAEKVASYPRQLSAGQQQRVVIARALMNRPEMLMADEPSSDLDEQTEAEIMDLFKDIHLRTAVTILMVTHAKQLVSYGTRAVEMTAGKVQELSPGRT
jgi:ABC-type lipoprotein export system ATPase subunit